MDVHVFARLGLDGKIHSVESKCSSNDNGLMSPMSPDGATNNGSEKFVPYTEKKRLVCTLGEKVDEMSIMVCQLADLSKRNKLQDKLIGQYESKFATQQKKIQKLETEIFRLKSQVILSGGKIAHTCSLDRSVTNHKHVSAEMCRGEGFGINTRSLSWPGGINGHTSSTLLLPNTRFNDKAKHDEVNKGNLVFVSNKTSSNGDEAVKRLTKASRPQCLRFDLDISSSQSRLNLDFGSHFQQQDELARHGYSYVQKHVELTLTDNDGGTEPKTMKTTNADTQRGSPALFPVDENGYLDMNRAVTALPVDELLYDPSSSDTTSVVPADSHADQIHVSHREVNKGQYCSKPDFSTHAQFETEKCLSRDKTCSNGPEVCQGTPRYETIHIVDDIIPVVRPPVPPRRISSKSSLYSPQTEESEQRQRSTCCKNTQNDDYIEPRRKSLPLESQNCTKDDRSKSQNIRIGCSWSSSSLSSKGRSPLTPIEAGTKFESNAYNIGEARKDDTCTLNRLFKDMRTTMEWCETKKRLMDQSHINTVDHIENKLRAVVEGVFKTYRMLKKETRSRQPSKEKVLKTMKETMKEERTSMIVCDDFLVKCIDMVIITTPV